MARKRKALPESEYYIRVKHGRVIRVHEDVLRWRKRRKRAEAKAAEKARLEAEAKLDPRYKVMAKVSFEPDEG